MRSSVTSLAACAVLAASLLLAGCGLKDDLYLPEPESNQTDETDDDAENA